MDLHAPIIIEDASGYHSYGSNIQALRQDWISYGGKVRFYEDLDHNLLLLCSIPIISSNADGTLCVHVFNHHDFFCRKVTIDEALRTICWANGTPFGIKHSIDG